MSAAKKSTSPRAATWRVTVIGGVRVRLAPYKRVLPKEEDQRLRQAVKDFYAGKKGK